MEMPDLIARPVGMSGVPEGTEVKVEVEGAKRLPEGIKSLRARARALVAAGAVPSIVDSVEDITMGQIQALTKVKGEPRHTSSSRFTSTLEYTVIVSRD